MGNDCLEFLNTSVLKEHFALPKVLPEAELPLQIFHTNKSGSIFDYPPESLGHEENTTVHCRHTGNDLDEEDIEMKYLARISQATTRS